MKDPECKTIEMQHSSKDPYLKVIEKTDGSEELTALESRFIKLPQILQRTADGIGHYLSQVGVVLVGIIGLLPKPWNVYLGIAGAITVLVSSFLVRRRQRLLTSIEKQLKASGLKCDKLSGDIETIRFNRKADREIVLGILAETAKNVSRTLNLWDNDTRLSLYGHNATSKEFTRLARVSDNPALETTGRIIYPDNEGFIADVWQGKPSFALDMPKTRKRWEQYQTSQFHIDPITASKLSMHTRCMIGARIDYKAEPIGVVIIESTAEGRLSSDDADALKNSRILMETISRLLVAGKIGLSDFLAESDGLATH